MNDSEFLRTSPKAKRNLLSLMIAAVALGATFAFVLRPALFEHIRQLPACGQARWSFALLLSSLGLLPVVSLWAGTYARKLFKFGQHPLPGAWVWRDTPIARGRSVQVRAWGTLTCSIALMAIALWGWHALWPVVATISSRCAT